MNSYLRKAYIGRNTSASLCNVISFAFLIIEFLVTPIDVADISAMEFVSPDFSRATSSVVIAVIQNKLINVAAITRL